MGTRNTEVGYNLSGAVPSRFGSKLTEQQRANQSEVQSRPDVIEKKRKSRTGYTNSALTRKKISESNKKAWADPGKRKRLLDGVRKVADSAREKMSFVKKQRWADADFVNGPGKDIIEALVSRAKSPEARAAMSARRKGKKASAETRLKMSLAQKARRANIVTP